MTRRTPNQYKWDRLEFDETILSKHITSPRRSKIQFVVVHHMTIVGKGDGKANDACYKTWQTREASAHYGVDGKFVRQFVWDRDAAWSTANSTGNHAGISIEHANSTAGPKWEVSDTTWKNGAKLAAYLHVVYKLGRPVAGKTLRRHRDFFATACPGPFLGEKIWAAYVKEAQRVYDEITATKPTNPTAPVTPPKPAKPKQAKWFTIRCINTWGNDNAEGTRTFLKRMPSFVDSATRTGSAVIAFQEVQDKQEAALTKAMKAKGYVRIAYDSVSNTVTYGRKDRVTLHKAKNVRYATQNAGQREGVSMAHVTVNGFPAVIGNTHLDYRDGFDEGRVRQAKEGFKALDSFAEACGVEKAGRFLVGDMNSKGWVTDRAAEPAGYRDAFEVAGKAKNNPGRIDYLYTATGVSDAFQTAIKSDHRMQTATFTRAA